MQSKELTEFYKGYVQWVEDGADPYDSYFDRGFGLCAAAGSHTNLWYELREQLVKILGDCNYPFTKNWDEYWKDSSNKTHHLNPLRLQWCKDRLAEATSSKDRIKEAE